MANKLKDKASLLNILHFIQAVIGAFVAIAFAYPSWMNCIVDPSTFSKATAITGIILLGYSLCQFWLIHKRSIKIYQVIIYPILYLLIGFSLHLAISGYIKDWAPASSDEALVANLISLVFLCVIFSAATMLTFKNHPDNEE